MYLFVYLFVRTNERMHAHRTLGWCMVYECVTVAFRTPNPRRKWGPPFGFTSTMCRRSTCARGNATARNHTNQTNRFREINPNYTIYFSYYYDVTV